MFGVYSLSTDCHWLADSCPAEEHKAAACVLAEGSGRDGGRAVMCWMLHVDVGVVARGERFAGIEFAEVDRCGDLMYSGPFASGVIILTLGEPAALCDWCPREGVVVSTSEGGVSYWPPE
eukprot:1184476-Prorocentrum_minimum.AAC.3